MLRAQTTSEAWVGTWSASQQTPEPQNALAPSDMTDATIRQIIHLSIGGATPRVHLSNAFGRAPLHFTSVHIARTLSASSPEIDPASDRALTFSGSSEVNIPAGAEYIINYPVDALSNLAITFYLAEPPAGETSHPGSRETSYYIHGDHVSSANLAGAKTIDHWYQLSGVDVQAPPGAGSVVVLGDSITDGHALTTNGNDRWIRAPGHFDAVLDFDKAMRDPAQPDRLRPDYDSGDHLHPSPTGYRAMGNAVPLSLFTH